jgi:hypothetical protein
MFKPPEGVRGTHGQNLELPTVQLLRVISKCWDDDTERLRTWTVNDSLLPGHCEERDRSGMWNTLRGAIHNVWPNLKEWIMKNVPGEDNRAWFTRADGIGAGEEDYIADPHIATKHSSSERVGFFCTFSPPRVSEMKYPVTHCVCPQSFVAVSENAYNAACALVQDLAGRDRKLLCLLDAGINPFFIIYACADCGISLPHRFSLELFWRHLDAIIQAQCWRGLGANRAYMIQESTRGGSPAMPSKFSLKDDDPQGILGSLMAIAIQSHMPVKMSDSAPVHQLCIAIRGGQWIAQSELGGMWFDASDLADNDVAPFAVLDSLTRVLPRWSGGIVHINSQNVQLLWGVCGGPHSGAWTVVWALCESHHVQLRGQWAGLDFRDMHLPADPRKRAALVPVRNANVVGAVVQELGVMKGGNRAYQHMICHLSRPDL